MDNRQIKFAVIGCGRISSAHISAIEKAPNAVLVAVCDIKEEAAKAAAKAAGIDTYYTDIETMLKSADIDAVCICTPSGLHADHTVLAANYGKHVICEKPLDITHEKLDLMINTCKEKGVLLGGIFQRRNCSAALIAKKAMEEKKIGRVVMADAYLKYFRDQEYYDSDAWRGTWALDGGGALMNQCIHGVDLLRYIAGEIESVTAKCETLIWDIEVEDTAAIIVKLKSGGIGVIEAATSVTPGLDSIISIHGTEGSICFGNEGFYTWSVNDKSPMPEVTDGMGGLNCGWCGDSLHALLIQDLCESIIEGKQPQITAEDARKSVDIILAIYESSKTGKEVFLNK